MTVWDPGIMTSNAGTPSYTAQELRFYLRGEDWDEGVSRPTGLKVTERGAGANMSVDVAAGDAVVQGDDSTNQGRYTVRSDATYNLTGFTAPSGSNQRYDLVVLKMNDPDAGGSAGRTGTIERVAGTAATSPTVPSTPASCLLLAVVGPFTSSSTSIPTSLIHDAQSGTGPSGAAVAHLLAGHRKHVGALEPFAGASGWVPNGWFLCYGQAISRTTYADLFAMLGTTYGSGDGSTTFNVPDLRGRSLFGLDNMGGSDAARLSVSNTLGGTGGAETHTLTEAQLPVVTVAVDPPETNLHINGGSLDGLDVEISPTGSGLSGVERATVSSSNAARGHLAVDIPSFDVSFGSGSAHNNMPPYMLANWIVRT